MTHFNVAKFGGTSVADLSAMHRCAQIVLSDSSTRLVVLSASSGVTNHLVNLTNNNLSQAQREQCIEAVEIIQHNILCQLELDNDLLMDYIATWEDFVVTARKNQFNDKQRDELLSFGERLSTFLFTQVLRNLGADVVRLDVRDVLVTDSHFGKAEPNIVQTRALAQQKIIPVIDVHVVVTQGFIGVDQQGNTTTLGRGGSDYSAALLAEAIDANAVHIWTDVKGIFSTDPRLCQKASPIAKLSFDEAAEMATFGAKVLHPATILPASRSGIKVFVGSSSAPELGGTWIEKDKSEHRGIRAVTQRKNQILVTVKSPEMLLASGFLARVFSILAKYNISVDLVTTSEISIALTLDNAPNAARPELNQQCLLELNEFCHVTIENNLTLIGLIGSAIQLGQNKSNLMSILSDFNIRLICHGASKHNLCFLVEQSESDGVVQAIHSRLLESA